MHLDKVYSKQNHFRGSGFQGISTHSSRGKKKFVRRKIIFHLKEKVWRNGIGVYIFFMNMFLTIFLNISLWVHGSNGERVFMGVNKRVILSWVVALALYYRHLRKRCITLLYYLCFSLLSLSVSYQM